MESNRKLAVILHADVTGSTHLVRIDEGIAHRRMRDAFTRFSEIITKHAGKTQEIRGDALVAEFGMGSNAVAAAITFQSDNQMNNDMLPDDVRPFLRVGIAMGEVVIADDIVTGEGVVLAQRLEQLAEPGGVCIQDAVYQTIPKRFAFEYEQLGEQKLKGFDETVRAYAVRQGRELNRPASGSPGEVVADLLPKQVKPIVAVLPFINMSGDPDQEYFSDGVTEDIITELSRFRTISVIARTSTFVYKGEGVPLAKISEELGVDYVLEGSVRRSGNTIRINAQLIEASSGNHVWAERFDRDMSDIFTVQDEVTRLIVGTISGRLEAAEAQKSLLRSPQNLSAYDCLLRGLQVFDSQEKKDIVTAQEYFEEATRLDPGYARAHTFLAFAGFCMYWYAYADRESLTHVKTIIEKSVELDIDDPFARAVRGLILYGIGRHDEGISNLEKSIKFNPNDAQTLHWTGFVLLYAGRAEEGVRYIREAIRLNPFNGYYDTALGISLYQSGKFEEAADVLRKYLGTDYRWNICYLAAACGQSNQMELAKKAADKFVALREQELQSQGRATPESTLELAEDELGRWYYRRSEDILLVKEGLIKAGLS